METESVLENKFPPERNENRALPSQPETRAEGMTHPLERENKKSAISGTPEVHILSFHSSKPSVYQVENVFKDVYEELAIPSNPKASADQHINIQDYIMKHKPEYLVLVSDLEYIQDMLHLDNQVQLYKEIVKSFSFGAKLVFIITVDKNYREGYLISDVVHIVFTTLNQDIPGSEQPMVMSWNTTPWSVHKDALVQLLSPYGNVQRATPQQYGATGKYDPIPSVPSGTQPERAPRGFYRASISYGRVVDVLKSEPRGWKPDEGDLNNMLMKHGSAKKAIIEFWDKGDGCGLQCAVHRSETKLYKIAEGVATNKQFITVYSYHADEKTMDEVRNFVHHVGAHELLPCPSIEPLSLMHEIKFNNPDYVMFSADFDVLGNAHEVKKLMLEQGHNIKDIIENHVGAAQYASDKGYLRYKAIISYSKVTQVLECDPPDWKPDEAILNKVLFENKKEKKALLEIWVNKAGDISFITVATESKIKVLKDTFSGYLGYLTSSFSKKKKDEKKPDTEYSV
ncbi:uncharacterized protein LOC116304701 [Actinia tenebrosa]|uniref:Uncharacterized protein LOC116304701 n=1 Tax=Actinia tenebrosa TaxID=6105 RepID=A0A6P8ITK1_ACTTE|nr:uncharacterized protein LOC116304701 [Actinia tenebrosa]